MLIFNIDMSILITEAQNVILKVIIESKLLDQIGVQPCIFAFFVFYT